MHKYIRLILLLSLVFLFAFANSQDAAPMLLKLKNNTNHRVRYFRNGKRIKFRLKADTIVNKGRIIAIEDSTIIINDVRYKLTDFAMISGRPAGMTVARGAGALVATGGSAMIYMGVSLLTEIKSTNDEWAKFGNVMIGIAGAAVILSGGIVTMVGVVPLIINVKKFDLQGKWSISSCRK